MAVKVLKAFGIAACTVIALAAVLWLLLFVSLFYESRTTNFVSTPSIATY